MSIWSRQPHLTAELIDRVNSRASNNKTMMQVFRDFAEMVSKRYGEHLSPKACEVRYRRATIHQRPPEGSPRRVNRLAPEEREKRAHVAKEMALLISKGLSIAKACESVMKTTGLTERQVRWSFDKYGHADKGKSRRLTDTLQTSPKTSAVARPAEDILLDAVTDLLKHGPAVMGFDLIVFAQHLAALARSAVNPAKALEAETQELRAKLAEAERRLEDAEDKSQRQEQEIEQLRARVAEKTRVSEEIRELKKDIDFLFGEWVESKFTGARSFETRMRVVLDKFNNVLEVVEDAG